MVNELGEIAVKVEQEGAEDAMEGLSDSFSAEIPEGDGGQGGGGGGVMGGLMSAIGGLSAAMTAAVAGIGAVLGVLLSMEPIQKMLKGFLKIAQAFLAPMAKMLIKLLAPVMKKLIQLLPMWFEFWSDPIGKIQEALDWVNENVEKIPGLIGSALTWLGGKLLAGLKEVPGLMFSLLKGYLSVLKTIGKIYWEVFKQFGSWLWDKLKTLPSMFWEFMKSLPQMIGSYIADVIPGSDLFGNGGDRRSDRRSRGGGVSRQKVDVNVSGYNDEETKDVFRRGFERR